MKVTGYLFREAIKQHELRRDTAARSFKGSLKSFPDEKKEPPEAIVDAFLLAERKIARLQTAQARYNLTVTVDVLGEKLTLSEVIKSLGGLARAEKMWREAAGPKEERYGYSEHERDPSKVLATVMIDQTKVLQLASAAAKRAGAFRAAMSIANTREIDIENLDPALFE